MKQIIYFLMGIGMITQSCNKKDFLEASPNQSLTKPETIPQLQALLDNIGIMNGMSSDQMGVTPALGEASCDDYYLVNFPKTGAGQGLKKIYLWQDDENNKYYDWDYPYRAIEYANTTLDGISKIHPQQNEMPAYNNVKGSALFFRAILFYQLAQIFAKPYDSNTAKNDPGIWLRLESDVNQKSHRHTVQQTYDEIIHELKQATELLPDAPMGGYATRPSKPAALALLAKTFLLMEKYDSALYYANACLHIKNSLMDYNEIQKMHSHQVYPFQQFNTEVIFHSCIIQTTVGPLFSAVRHRVDSTLYNLYDSNDLRKTLFFVNSSPGVKFRGSYDGTSAFFTGIATDEVYLIQAECLVRTGNTADGMNALNTLLEKRWETGTFRASQITDSAEALQTILIERRKELPFRNIRWSDLRRLNKQGAGIIVYRNVDGVTDSLLPGSLHYIFLIPSDVLDGMPQNPRQ